MQLYALDKSSLVLASHAVRDRSYLCPECHGFVRIRGGGRRQIHFYHARRPASCRQHGKSLAHLQIQLHLKSLIPGLTLEKRFESRIADAHWADEKIAFEVQCSPISIQEAKTRCEDYLKLGLIPVWILHDRDITALSSLPQKSILEAKQPHFIPMAGVFMTNLTCVRTYGGSFAALRSWSIQPCLKKNLLSLYFQDNGLYPFREIYFIEPPLSS